MSANNRLRFDGLAELRQALRNLPAELTAEAANLIEGEANAAALAIRRGYPLGETGNLVEGVIVTHFEKSKVSTGAIVKNTAKHAYIFEHGTQVRRNAKGANRGAMPPGRVFIPRMQEARRRVHSGLRLILQRAGLAVTDGG